VFKALRPETEVPAELLAADERIAARPLPARDGSPPPQTAPVMAPSGPKFYTAAEQLWFKNLFCNPFTPGGGSQFYETTSIVECNQAYGPSLGTNWVQGEDFHTQHMLGSEAGQAATLQIFWWNGHSAQQELQTYVNPGTWTWTDNTDYGDWSSWGPLFSAWFFNGGSKNQMSQAVEDCGGPNEWSCDYNCGEGQGCNPYTTLECSAGGDNNGWCVHQ
jgi:hypothetical protein